VTEPSLPAEPVAVGLVGAGTWARRMHAPMLAAGPETRLAAVWSRHAGSALSIVDDAGPVPVTDDFDAFLDTCAAVAFAVPPDVQASLAIRAARAGKAVLLEKPLALDLPAAAALAEAVDRAGVVSQVVFTKRYHPRTRAFLAAAAGFPATGGRSCYLHGGFLDGPFAGGWRQSYGALFDLGPHLLDLLDAAAGPITEIRAAGDRHGWVELTARHASGATSQASLSGHVGLPRPVTTLDLYGPGGALHYDTEGMDHDECWPILRREFAQAVRSGRPHPLDVHRGLAIQRLITQAAAALADER
jgi:predicted dehydrogenase